MTLEICGVKFIDPKQYRHVKRVVDSLLIEGMQPTFERVKAIKDLLDGNVSPDDIKNKYERIQKA